MTSVRKSLKDLSISKKRLSELAARKEEDIKYSDIPEIEKDFRHHAAWVKPPEKRN